MNREQWIFYLSVAAGAWAGAWCADRGRYHGATAITEIVAIIIVVRIVSGLAFDAIAKRAKRRGP